MGRTLPYRGPLCPGYAEFAPCLPVRRPRLAFPGLAADCANSIFHTRNDMSLVVENAHLIASGLERHPGGQAGRCCAGRGPSPGDGIPLPNLQFTGNPSLQGHLRAAGRPSLRPTRATLPSSTVPPGKTPLAPPVCFVSESVARSSAAGLAPQALPKLLKSRTVAKSSTNRRYSVTRGSSALLRLQRQQNVDRGVDVRDEVVGFGGA